MIAPIDDLLRVFGVPEHQLGYWSAWEILETKDGNFVIQKTEVENWIKIEWRVDRHEAYVIVGGIQNGFAVYTQFPMLPTHTPFFQSPIECKDYIMRWIRQKEIL